LPEEFLLLLARFASIGGKPPIEVRLAKKPRRSRIQRGWRTIRGGVVDTGAPVSVIELKEDRLYFQLYGIHFDRGKASTRSFKFGSTACKSQGVMKILIPSLSPCKTAFCFSADIVNIDEPLLIGLDVQKAEQIDISASTQTLSYRRNGSTIPLDDDGHLGLRWPIGQFKTYYTKPQLQRPRRQLLHPSSKRLLKSFHSARPENLPPETQSMIDDIPRVCETCATWDRRPTTFCIRDTDDVVLIKSC
jgi:hypothetical protein